MVVYNASSKSLVMYKIPGTLLYSTDIKEAGEAAIARITKGHFGASNDKFIGLHRTSWMHLIEKGCGPAYMDFPYFTRIEL